MFGVFSQLIEFFSRLWLVNVPTYVITHIPESRVCVTYLLSYILVQNVGFLWAFLVNASFAVACQVAAFLPFQDPVSTLNLVTYFYLVYSSVRIIAYFAAAMGKFAIFCLQDFSGIERLLLMDRDLAINFYHIVFGIIILLELSLLLSDMLCSQWFPFSSIMCHNPGLMMLTQRFPNNRRLIYCLLSAVVISLWQCVMHLFPRWNKSIMNASRRTRICFQATIVSLSISTIFSLTFLLVRIRPSLIIVHDYALSLQLLMWTAVLYLFVPLLISSSQGKWMQHISCRSLKRLFLILCMSQGFFILVYTFYRGFDVGIIGAQLEYVVACFCLPSFWILIVLLARGLCHTSLSVSGICAPVIFVLSAYFSKTASLGGNGSAILMFLHAFGKINQFFGQDIEWPIDAQESNNPVLKPRIRTHSVINAVTEAAVDDSTNDGRVNILI